jgi:hypothetical protein
MTPPTAAADHQDAAMTTHVRPTTPRAARARPMLLPLALWRSGSRWARRPTRVGA